MLKIVALSIACHVFTQNLVSKFPTYSVTDTPWYNCTYRLRWLLHSSQVIKIFYAEIKREINFHSTFFYRLLALEPEKWQNALHFVSRDRLLRNYHL